MTIKFQFNQYNDFYEIDLNYIENNLKNNVDYSIYLDKSHLVNNCIYLLFKTIVTESKDKKQSFKIAFFEDTIELKIINFKTEAGESSHRFFIPISDLDKFKDEHSSLVFFGKAIPNPLKDYFCDIQQFKNLFNRFKIVSEVFDYPFFDLLSSVEYNYIENKYEELNEENSYSPFICCYFEDFIFQYSLNKGFYQISNKNFIISFEEDVFSVYNNKQSVSLRYLNPLNLNKNIVLSLLNTEPIKFENLNDFIKLNSLINY